MQVLKARAGHKHAKGIVDELTNRSQQGRNKRDADQYLANGEEDRAEAMIVVLK